MSAEMVSGLINIALPLYAALIGWDIVKIKIAQHNQVKWERYKSFVKWGGTIATAGFTFLFLYRFF
ncbi:hypothetical protein [Marinicellulosiphila megalodicopiae]|uniref:hypothetical protein n=1 Tax=Marinicellulosiphila megalodicopiae TaxID=2724896 RepID=UPI003BAEB309